MRSQPAPSLQDADTTPDLHAELDAARAELATMRAELAAARGEAQRLRELLDLARGFGRLGVWERDVQGPHAHWDEQVYSFFGMAPQAGAPAFADVVGRVAAADRDTLALYFHDSTRQAGRYSFRYRIRQPDGTLRRMQSQWIVKNGDDGQPKRMLGLLMDDSEPFRLAQSAGELESQLALAVDLGGIAIWRHDLKTQRIHYNEQAYRVLDIPPRPDGLSIAEVRALIHPDDLPQVMASAAAALTSDRPTDMEARYRRSDNTWRDVLTRRVVLRDLAGDAVAFIGVAMDVTERVEQTRRAAGLMRRFELVTRTAGIGHWSVQGRHGHPQWSDTLFAVFGLPPTGPAPQVSEWVAQYVHPADRHAMKEAFLAWMRSGRESNELAFRIVRADGSERQLVSHSRREVGAGTDDTLLYGVVIDITERHSAEKALRSASERAALATRAVGLATWELDLVTSQTLWDEQMWRLRGHTPRAGAMNAAERLACVHPDDRAHISGKLYEQIHTAQPVDQEFRVVWPNGEVHWLSSRSMPVLDADGRLLRRIGVTWDVTAQRNADAMRQEGEIALRESAAKSRFLARMSHELRTPLNAVLGFTQLLLADEAVGSLRRRRLDHIHGAGRHLLALINDVLDLASLQSGELRIACKAVALAPLVAQTLPLLGPAAGLGGGAGSSEPNLSTGALDFQVLADPTRLRQVLLNLLSNAVKYNRPGGQVHIEALAEGDWVVLRITDSGYGMDDAQLKQLFEPFNRLGREAQPVEGTGIGLAIVKALVEGMGGNVRVTSRPDEGTRFEVRLAAPGEAVATEAAVDGSEPPAAPSAAVPVPGRQILYIEDNPVNALIISQLLQRRRDLVLTVAEDGTRGVALAAELRPDLILLDMQLPDFDGIEVMRRLRADPATARIPCIALSANAMPEDIDAALRAGAADYWTKPLEFKAFLESLDALFGRPPAAPVALSPKGGSASGPAEPDPRPLLG